MSDDLTLIKGIDFTKEKCLNELGIDTYAKLADGDPGAICEQLKTKIKPSVSSKIVNSWIEAAKTMNTDVPISEPVTNVIPIHPENLDVLAEEGWSDFATFYVAYQHKQHVYRTIVYRTTADHIEGNEYQRWEWSDINDTNTWNELRTWIMGHVSILMSSSELQQTTDNKEAKSDTQLTKPSEIRIVSIQVYDSAGGLANASSGKLFIGSAHSQQLLTFEFNLEYLTSDSDDIRENNASECQISLYIYEMPGDKLALKPQKISRRLPESRQANFSVTMTSFELPAGLYRIRAVATLTNQTPVLSVIDIPLLQII